MEEKQYHNKLLSLTAHLKIVINFLEFVYSTEILSDLRLKDFEMISPQNISRLESSRKELRKLYKEFVDKIINILLNYSSTKTIVRTNITRENIMKFLKFYNKFNIQNSLQLEIQLWQWLCPRYESSRVSHLDRPIREFWWAFSTNTRFSSKKPQ